MIVHKTKSNFIVYYVHLIVYKSSRLNWENELLEMCLTVLGLQTSLCAYSIHHIKDVDLYTQCTTHLCWN